MRKDQHLIDEIVKIAAQQELVDEAKARLCQYVRGEVPADELADFLVDLFDRRGGGLDP